MIDLALEGACIENRRDVDPMVTLQGLEAGTRRYLNGADPRDPRANALYGNFDKLLPVRIDVGDDEILLDEALRFEAMAGQAGCVAETHVWKGMIHVFPIDVAMLKAAGEALDGTAEFLERYL